MAPTNEAPCTLSVSARQLAVDAVLSSGTFLKNPRLAALLEYLCVRSLRGEADFIKEYNIATDVFGRSAEFDQSTDAIVRVEMHRLRKKLKEFYSGEGVDQPLAIVIHSGRYLPEFVIREKLGFPESSPEPASGPSEAAVEVPAREPIRISRRFMWVGIAAVVVVIAAAVAAVGLAFFRRESPVAAAKASDRGAVSRPLFAVPPGEDLRILCGAAKSGYRDRTGNEWGVDAFYSGGSAAEAPPHPLYRTGDSSLFRSLRTGEFSYKIPLKPGVYELRLYFADTSYSPGAEMEGGENVRVFSVWMNGAILLRDFDIIEDAGPDTADVKVFKDVSPAKDGYLHLGFSKTSDKPLLNAIEIVPGIPHRLRPIRIVTRDNTYTDRTGVTWYPDNYFLSGRTIGHLGAVIGAEDPEIYARERYGRFSYAIPVANGRYAVTLHLAETFWGPNDQGAGGIGSRIFDVYCNGVTLLRNLDMFKEAGSHRQLTKTFHNLEPSPQGTLLLSFVPVRNYANISAIEVADEAP